MVLVDKNEIKIIHALLSQIKMAGDKDYKRDLVQEYTNGRETSTTKLSVSEAGRLIQDLRQTVQSATDIKKLKKRRLIIHYAHMKGWESNDRKVDMERVNGWCVKYGQYHKLLNAHNLTELSHLIVQMEKAYKDFLRSV